MATITVEQAQQALANAHRTISGWREQKEVFLGAAKLKPQQEKAIAEAMAAILGACIDEMSTALGDTRTPEHWKSDLLKEIQKVIERHGK